jgi:tetratricopeptide (TPR) repeat protein
MGILDEAAIQECLRRQALPTGMALSLSQVMVRDVQLPPEALFALKNELMRCHHRCGACGYGRYLAPGPQHRVEPCPKCGGQIPVPAAGSSMTATGIADREQAMRMSGSFRLRKEETADPLAKSGQGPRLFGDYVLDELLAKGGMGAVYKVRNVHTGQPFALKVLLAGTKASKKQLHRFRREAKVQMELDHRNIVKIHDAGEWEGVLYYAMAMIEGSDLDTFATLERNVRYRIIAKTCRALHYAHEQGYIHRDLKPANILIDQEGEPLLTDFGLTKNLEGTTQLTQEGAIMGTPFYMSPEQATGKANTMGPPSDIFSMGVLLYQMATGELPFMGESAIELYRSIVDAHPMSFAAHGIMEPHMEQVTFKAMQKEPELRYASAEDLAEDIERVLRGDNPLASSVSSASKVALKVEKHKRSIGFILGTVVVGLVGVVGLLVTGKIAYTKMKASQAFEQRESDGKDALFAMQQALTDVDSLPPREATRALVDALKAADVVLSAHGPETREIPSAADVQALRADVLMAQARLELLNGSGSGARRALECLAGLDPREGESAHRVLALRARACRRLGQSAEADAALAELAAAAPKHEQLPLLNATRARLAGDDKAVITLLKGIKGTAAAIERARAHVKRGDLERARKIMTLAAENAKRSDRLHLRWGEALIEVGLGGEAAEALTRALDLNPGDLDAAERLLTLSLALGRPFEVASALAEARKRRPGTMELDVLWLRAKSHLGGDSLPRLKELSDLPYAALAAADLAAAGGDVEAYGSLAKGSLAHRATVARWNGAKGSPGDLSVFEPLLADTPLDRPPSPKLARALRDLGWAYLAAGSQDPAKRAAVAALRGLPGDLDTHFLLATLDETKRDTLNGAFVAEADALGGALGRGLLVSRLARWNKKQTLIPVARALLVARLAGDPSLVPVHEELARLRAFEDGADLPVFEPGLLDPALLPPLPKRVKVSAKDKKTAAKIAGASNSVKERKGESAKGLALAKKALAIDPYNARAREEFSDHTVYLNGRNPETRFLGAARFQVQPSWAFGYVFEFMGHWLQDSRFGTGTPRLDWETLFKKDPTLALHQIPWILDHYLGLLYPKFKTPKFTAGADPREVSLRVGMLLRLDPQFSGFLYVHAHLIALQGRLDETQRDLDLISLLIDGSFGSTEMSMEFWDWLYRSWIFSSDLNTAYGFLEKVISERLPPQNQPAIVYLGKTAVKLKKWFELTPAYAPLIADPRWAPMIERFVR